MSFRDVYKPKAEAPVAGRPAWEHKPPAASLLCEVCGFVHPDVLLGVCADCAPQP